MLCDLSNSHGRAVYICRTWAEYCGFSALSVAYDLQDLWTRDVVYDCDDNTKHFLLHRVIKKIDMSARHPYCLSLILTESERNPQFRLLGVCDDEQEQKTKITVLLHGLSSITRDLQVWNRHLESLKVLSYCANIG